MMREILFRGKTLDNGGWVYGGLIKYEITWSGGTSTHYDIAWNETDGRFERHEVNSETVGQFTGVLDKKGNKIFEGDIVKFEFRNHENRWIPKVGYVEFEFGRYLIANKGDFYTANSFENGEVIGNIYDNPELLKEDE